MKKYIIYFLPVLLCISCDCYVSVKGKVFSNLTKLPVEGASVEMVGRNEKTKTDKNGYFHLWQQTGSCFDPQIKIEKGNYKPFDLTIKSSRSTIAYELKKESEFVDYEKPFYPDTSNKGTFMIGTWISQFSSNFAFNGDTVLFYMDTLDVKNEIEENQKQLRETYK